MEKRSFFSLLSKEKGNFKENLKTMFIQFYFVYVLIWRTEECIEQTDMFSGDKEFRFPEENLI